MKRVTRQAQREKLIPSPVLVGGTFRELGALLRELGVILRELGATLCELGVILRELGASIYFAGIGCWAAGAVDNCLGSLCRRGRLTETPALSCLGVLSLLLVTWGLAAAAAPTEELPLPSAQMAPLSSRPLSEQVSGARVSLRSGRNLLDRGLFDAALALFREYCCSKPGDPEGFFWQAVALDEAGNAVEAIAAYTTAIEKAEKLGLNSAEIWTNLGNVLLKTGQLDRSIEALSKATEIDAQLVPARLNLARALIEKGQCEKALVSLNLCADLHFNGAQLSYYRAKAFLKLGRREEAAVQVDKMLLQIRDAELKTRAQAEFYDLLRARPASSQPAN